MEDKAAACVHLMSRVAFHAEFRLTITPLTTFVAFAAAAIAFAALFVPAAMPAVAVATMLALGRPLAKVTAQFPGFAFYPFE